MNIKSGFVLVIGYITCKNCGEARKIAKHLLKKKLIACANIVKEINSLYWWKGKIADEKEALLLVKTCSEKKSRIIKEVSKIHSYKIPCIEFLNVLGANKKYEKWLKKEIEGAC